MLVTIQNLNNFPWKSTIWNELLLDIVLDSNSNYFTVQIFLTIRSKSVIHKYLCLIVHFHGNLKERWKIFRDIMSILIWSWIQESPLQFYLFIHVQLYYGHFLFLWNVNIRERLGLKMSSIKNGTIGLNIEMNFEFCNIK